MLNDHERESLRDIQRQLFVEDPDFERSFRALEAPPPRKHRRWLYTAGIVVAALFATVSVLAGSVGGALAFTVVAGSLWFAEHHEEGSRQA